MEMIFNKLKMAYSRDLPKMARQQCGIMDWNCSNTYLEIEAGDVVWFGEMTSEFIHEEISIMDYYGPS